MTTEKSVCIIGAGPAGLITAHTLIQDGFVNVQVFTRDRSPGGTWSADRVYPELYINKSVAVYRSLLALSEWLYRNSVSGEYKFSSYPMPPPVNESPGGRLSGDDLRQYMESFAEKFLKDKIRFNSEVVAVRRFEGGNSNWLVTVEDLCKNERMHLPFDLIVLCTGVTFQYHSSFFILFANPRLRDPATLIFPKGCRLKMGKPWASQVSSFIPRSSK
jgi:dimethylaniline monooxygenase (N-oxide forming)